MDTDQTDLDLHFLSKKLQKKSSVDDKSMRLFCDIMV